MEIDTAGYTYCHEHLYIDLSHVKGDKDCLLDQYDNIRNELISLKALGVSNIIEVTNRFMGRNPHFIEDLMRDTQMNILLSTGYYIDGFFPDKIHDLTTNDIAGEMIDELTSGIDGSSLKASLIGEIGSSKGLFTETEKKVFKAAAIAHLETGAPISTHTSFTTCGIDQIDLLRKMKVNLEKVTIGHCDLDDNFDYLLKLLESGCMVQFDTIGKNSYYPDEKRANTIIKLINKGYAEQIMLSMDITRCSHLKANGGLGFSYLMECFIPLLIQKGLSNDHVETMMKHNPNKFFSY